MAEEGGRGELDTEAADSIHVFVLWVYAIIIVKLRF